MFFSSRLLPNILKLMFKVGQNSFLIWFLNLFEVFFEENRVFIIRKTVVKSKENIKGTGNPYYSDN